MATRTFQKAPFSCFAETEKHLAITGAALCERLGYASNAYCDWQKSGEMPRVASIACQALRASTPIPKDTVFLIRTGDKAEALTSILHALSLDFVAL